MEFETVMGLEVHCELATQTKIFCGCSTAFGAPPNTQVCPVCSGMPGTLPVLNEKVLDFALRTGVATHCTIAPLTRFDRKNYFYPDLPKAYQTSQLYVPLCRDGFVDMETEAGSKRIRIHEIHMEEDAGKLLHDRRYDRALVDLNRCGVPLLEIVTEPDFATAEEVLAFLTELRGILQYMGVSDCKMEQGSLRVDVNLSVRPVGQEKLGTRTEMKNLNSFRAIARAIAYESGRQREVLLAGETVVQESRRWDEGRGMTVVMRPKENVWDYGYFPEPDLPVLRVDEARVAAAQQGLPELPAQKRQRYRQELGLGDYETRLLTEEAALVRIFEGALAVADAPRECANWVLGEVLRLGTETATPPEQMAFDPARLGQVIRLLTAGKINRSTAKAVFEKVFAENIDPEAYVREQGLLMVRDAGTLAETVARVVAEHPKAVEEYRVGSAKVFQFLVGQTMKALKGKADPALVREALAALLDEEAEEKP